MKIKRVASLLCALFIICLFLASCDSRQSPEPPAESSSQALSELEETASASEAALSSQTDPPTTKAVTSTAKSTTAATIKNTTAAATTKSTTVRATERKTTTTRAPSVTTTKAPTTAAATTTQKRVDVGEYESEVIRLTNLERKNAGLAELKYSDELHRAAKIRAKEISTSFSHIRPDGSDCFSVSDAVMGENIAAGQSTPQSVVSSWMSSAGHRENILREYFGTVAIGCYYDASDNTYFWVQLFG